MRVRLDAFDVVPSEGEHVHEADDALAVGIEQAAAGGDLRRLHIVTVNRLHRTVFLATVESVYRVRSVCLGPFLAHELHEPAPALDGPVGAVMDERRGEQ